MSFSELCVTSLSINLVDFDIVKSYFSVFVSSAREYFSQRIYDDWIWKLAFWYLGKIAKRTFSAVFFFFFFFLPPRFWYLTENLGENLDEKLGESSKSCQDSRRVFGRRDFEISPRSLSKNFAEIFAAEILRSPREFWCIFGRRYFEISVKICRGND